MSLNREVVLHKRAAKYLRKMPKLRQIEMRDALRDVAELEDINTHPNVIPMKGSSLSWSRLRVGSYRAVLQAVVIQLDDALYVDFIGPRGGAYKK